MTNVLGDERDKEWIRRRQLRLVQVRKQSNDIAKQLRVRANNEERDKKIEKENEVELKLKLWKMKKLKDLEEMYRNAVNDIGAAHKLAMQDPDSSTKTNEKKKINTCKAKERGETAMEHALREKREAIERKLIPIQRKIIIRQIEDLRSSLVCSIPPQKTMNSRNISTKNLFNPKLFESSYEDEESTTTKISCHDKNEQIERKTVISSSEDHIRDGPFIPITRKPGNKMNKKTKRRPDSPYKTKTRSDRSIAKSSNISCRGGERFWVNLGAIEAITEVEDDETKKRTDVEEVLEVKKVNRRECQKEKESKAKSVKSVSPKKNLTLKKDCENNIECYGYSVRQKCNLKGDITSVRRVEKQSEPDPVELAREDEKRLELERNTKEGKMMAAMERGNKAIEKEKINRSYNELLAKLEKLSTKEKIIKTYCHIPPPHMFMSDERRQEKSIRKQRVMDSKFEKIYYETMGINPYDDLRTEFHEGEGVPEMINFPEKSAAILNLGELKWNPKTNSPASSSEGSDESKKRNSNVGTSPIEKVSVKKTPSSLHFKRTKISKGGEIVLSDIDRLLKKTRQLRQDSHLSVDHPPSECKLVAALSDRHLEKVEEKENVPITEDLSFLTDSSELGKSISLSPCEGHRVSGVMKKSGEDKCEPKKDSLLNLGMGDLGRDFPRIRTDTIAWPVHQVTMNRKDSDELCARSSTTSYRSLPSQILPKRINSLLKLLVQLKEREGKSVVADELIVKMEETLDSLIQEAEKSNLTINKEDCREFQLNPQLNYYIKKLLMMSRERIACLSVTSESDLSVQRNDESSGCESAGRGTPENQYLKQINKNSKCSNMKRAKELERVVKKWKKILNENCDNCDDSTEDEGACCPSTGANTPDRNSSYFDKFEEVSKKCSACISGLSSVLAGFRKDVPRDGEFSENENGGECGKVPKQECGRCKSPKRAERTQSSERSCPRQPGRSNAETRQEPECKQSADESAESLPDVMNVLLEKGLITSPFHWGTSESDDTSHCSAFCLDCKTPKPKKFQCKYTCMGACSDSIYAEAMRKRPDAAALRDMRKKMEKIPMKYLDAQYGIYSPVPMPRPFPYTPLEDDFVKKNFGQPLPGFPVPEPGTECKKPRPRQLYFKIVRDDRPNSEPQMSDKNDGSESDNQCATGEFYKRPSSSPGGRHEFDTTVEDSPEYNAAGGTFVKNVPCGGNATFVKNVPSGAGAGGGGGLDEKYFRPATPSDDSVGGKAKFAQKVHCGAGAGSGGGGGGGGGLNEKYFRPATPSDGSGGGGGGGGGGGCGLDEKYFRPVTPSDDDDTFGSSFHLGRNLVDKGECRRGDPRDPWSSPRGSYAQMMEGLTCVTDRRNLNKGSKGRKSCIGSCAVHCNRDTCHPSGNDGVRRMKSSERMTGSMTNMPCYAGNQTPSGRQSQEEMENARAELNLDWAKDFLQDLRGDECGGSGK